MTQHSNVLVTGATGLIGAALARKFASQGLRVVAAVRNVAKAEAMFGDAKGVEIVRWDILDRMDDALCKSLGDIDWFVHAASETSSRAFVERPVDTIRSVVHGAENALDAARRLGVSSMVFLSTMEVYGAPDKDSVTERDYGYLDPVAVRSCYPEAKRLAENLCVAYASQYAVPVKIARLTQTFGEGVAYNDGRVFADFARAIIERRPIVLKTEGTTARCYCYLGDAVDAIETLLAKGENGQAYTVANEETFCTIREMAEMLVAAHPEANSSVVFDFGDAEKRGFAPPFRMKLDCARLRALGWTPKVGLLKMFDKMIDDMKAANYGNSNNSSL